MLTLQESMLLAGQNLLDTLAPTYNYLPIWRIHSNPDLTAECEMFWPSHNVGRLWDALLRLEAATGFRIPPELETPMLDNLKRCLDNPLGVLCHIQPRLDSDLLELFALLADQHRLVRLAIDQDRSVDAAQLAFHLESLDHHAGRVWQFIAGIAEYFFAQQLRCQEALAAIGDVVRIEYQFARRQMAAQRFPQLVQPANTPFTGRRRKPAPDGIPWPRKKRSR